MTGAFRGKSFGSQVIKLAQRLDQGLVTAAPMTMIHFVKMMVTKAKLKVAFPDWHKKKPQIFCLKFVPCEEMDT